MVAIIGAGGHAKCAYECLTSQGFHVVGFFDDDHSKLGQIVIADVKVLGAPAHIALHTTVTCLFVAIGDNAERLSLYRSPLAQSYSLPNAVHIKAHVSPFAKLGKGNFLMGPAILNPASVIGDYCIINTSATVGHDCILEDAVQIGPGVNIAGGCTIKEGAFIGIGAKIAPGVTIGSWAVVGAGSVVLHDVPDRSFSIGIPARVTKHLEQRQAPSLTLCTRDVPGFEQTAGLSSMLQHQT